MQRTVPGHSRSRRLARAASMHAAVALLAATVSLPVIAGTPGERQQKLQMLIKPPARVAADRPDRANQGSSAIVPHGRLVALGVSAMDLKALAPSAFGDAE